MLQRLIPKFMWNNIPCFITGIPNHEIMKHASSFRDTESVNGSGLRSVFGSSGFMAVYGAFRV